MTNTETSLEEGKDAGPK